MKTKLNPPKIVPGSKEWPSHYKMIEELELGGAMVIRGDADMGMYNDGFGFKVDQPVGNHIKIKTHDKKQHLCHLSDLEVCDLNSIKLKWVKIKPGKYRLQSTIQILR
ncbi:MAG TPA: hypothetical protein PKB02_01525 [Anaerohalosphaeraceae bacterium]|nr:hypothetical protein [Anaerohalosphaeraceae bacterium]